MIKKYFIIFNDINSYDDLDLRIENHIQIPIPMEKIEFIDVPGSETLTVKKGFEDIKIEGVKFASRNISKSNIERIKNWLKFITNKKLVISDNTEKYYIVKQVTVTPINIICHCILKFEVSFVCSPFEFSSNEEFIEIKSTNFIVNDYNKVCMPYLKIYGQGDTTIFINEQIILLNDIEDYIEIDSKIGDCFKDDKLLNNKMIGDFPKLIPGVNNISWEGDVERIIILPRWEE